MWSSTFFQLVSMTAIFSAQVMAGDRQVTPTSDLGFEYSVSEKGLSQFKTSGGFFSQVSCSKEDKSIEIVQINNPVETLDSYEAVLSMWENQSELTVGDLRHVKYDKVITDADIQILDRAFATFDYGYDASTTKEVSAINVSRDSSIYAGIWASLRATSFGQDAIKMCTQFQLLDNFYITSFDFGKTGVNDRWITVNFEVSYD
ncbi:hypothetical protein CFO_g3586 [Ceratocystis platani]|uniref:Uncharacterized protein n=1 Tax=Ceratocystis fimbriata f. sp. platani TaxID=88771 RepID=A0A0F8BNG6_CERFI|nr:hypothetical protein CFO_g3586 [Ceratocystis platani]